MKKILIFVVPLLVVGAVVGAGVMGLVPIPGLSLAKKKAAAASLYSEAKDESAPVAKRPKKEEPRPLEPNLEKGRAELAKVWNELEPAVIVAMAEKWPDEDLARQLVHLETEKTAAVLSLMKPDRASKISKVLQVLGAEKKPGA